MQTAAKEKSFTYQRRRPELTPCYRVLAEELDKFLADRQTEGQPVPDYVAEEFEAYLKCGILSHGFLRLQCESCQKEKIVAFSCKKRGFCPSCCAKRMVEASTHLVENVLPVVPYRQFVVSFPIPMRYWLQANRKLYAKIHKIMIAQVHKYYIDKAAANGIKDSKPGSISFTQRWGAALNLNVHCHILCPDGVYTNIGDDPRFRNVDPITDDEVAALVERIAHSVMRYFKKMSYIDKEGEIVQNPKQDELFTESQSLSLATACSINGKIAFGPNTGKYVTKIGKGFGYLEEIPLAKGKRCYSVNGFSLHANTSVNALARDRLAKLIEYIARGPLANERLEITSDRKVKLQLKTPYSDGTTHLLFTFSEFIEKLMALVPPPKSHLVRWGGVFAPNSSVRKQITLKPHIKKGFQFDEEEEEPKVYKNQTWSKMLAKAFKIDVTTCDHCSGKLKKICAVNDRDSIRRYLLHQGIDPDPPARRQARTESQEFDFDQGHVDQTDARPTAQASDDGLPVICIN